MNITDFLIKAYSLCDNPPHCPEWVMTLPRHTARTIGNKLIPRLLGKEIGKDYKNNPQADVIVSFTSFPGRIDIVWIVVMSLLRQTIRPRKILLWLSKEQFQNGLDDIPERLKDLQNDCFEIRFVVGDVKSHKKYFYVLNEFRENDIILVDDDLFYPSDMIEKLTKERAKHPGCIISRYGYLMRFSDNGRLMAYNSWKSVSKEISDKNFFFGTGGGTLLNRELLWDDVCKIDLALKLAPKADDVWLNAMAKIKDTQVIKINAGIIMPIKNHSDSLMSSNVVNNLNDIQIRDVANYYINSLNINPYARK